MLEVGDNAVIGEELGGHMKALWADDGIQAAYQRRAEFQLYDSADLYVAIRGGRLPCWYWGPRLCTCVVYLCCVPVLSCRVGAAEC